MYELRIDTYFAAAHQLPLEGRKCENLHGHNWKIEVHVAGDTLDAAGVLLDFGILKQHLKAVMEELDHRFLNELDCFRDKPPSSEHIARYVAERLQTRLEGGPARVVRVSAWESEDARATYIP